MSRIDVVIPCYKYAHYLRGCVESVLAQPGVDLRVLILDDCSPDNTPEVAAELMARDSRVEFRRHATNRGHIATYNEGLLEWATGDYVLLLSADDLLTPGALGRAARLFEAHPEVGLVCGKQIVFQTNEELLQCQPVRADGYRILDTPAFLKSFCAVGSNPVMTPTAVVRNRLLKELGGYRKELPHTADMELWMRIGVHASVGILEAEQAYKRSHGQNMQVAYTATVVRDLQQRLAAFEILFQEKGDRIPQREELESLARRSLAQEAFWAGSRAFEQGDLARSQEFMDLALGIDPELRRQPIWTRWQWKRRLGPRLCSWMSRFRARALLAT